LNSVSQVPGVPSENRWMIFINKKVNILTPKESYEPAAVAKFTVNHAKRSQMGITLGMSEANEDQPTSIWIPGAIIFQGGEYEFDGTTTPTDGTFILDFTDLINAHGIDGNAFYLNVEDNTAEDAVTVKDFRVIDYEKGGITYISSEVPQDVDAGNILLRVTGFEDIPPGYWAEDAIYKIYDAGITTGCSKNPLRYCPLRDVNRAQMAVFLERGINGGNFTPPPATGIFDDVPADFWAADWIEHLYKDGITTGCTHSPLKYCPDRAVNRAQMAIFLLRSKNGSNYTPPPATGIFEDVAVTHWAADWIEQLYTGGITTGCKTSPLSYCPDRSVRRDAMAVFLMRTFGL